MIAAKQSWQKLEFLLSEGEKGQNISTRLKQVYGDSAIDYSTVTRWVKQINDGQKNFLKAIFVIGHLCFTVLLTVFYKHLDVYIDILKKLKARMQRV